MKKITALLIALIICAVPLFSALAEPYYEYDIEFGYEDEYYGEDEENIYASPDESEEEYTEYLEENSKPSVPLIWIPISLVLGIVAGFVIINSIAAKNKSVKFQKNATVYTRGGSFVLTGSSDNFLYKNLERVPKPKNPPKK